MKNVVLSGGAETDIPEIHSIVNFEIILIKNKKCLQMYA